MVSKALYDRPLGGTDKIPRRIIQQPIHLPKFFDRFGQDMFDLFGVTHVAGHGQYGTAGFVHEFLRRVVNNGLSAAAYRDVGPELQQIPADGFAETRAPAGYNDCLSFERVVAQHATCVHHKKAKG